MTKSSIFFLQITIFLSCVLILLQIYRSENKLINVQQTYFLTTCAIKANYVYEHVCTTQTHLQQPAALLSWFITHECRYTIGMLADPLVKALSLSLSLHFPSNYEKAASFPGRKSTSKGYGKGGKHNKKRKAANKTGFVNIYSPRTTSGCWGLGECVCVSWDHPRIGRNEVELLGTGKRPEDLLGTLLEQLF